MNTLLNSGPTPPAAAAPADPTVQPQQTQAQTPAVDPQKRAARFKAAIEESRRVRNEFVQNEWKRNVDYRRNRPYKTEAENNDDRVVVPYDWSFTK